MRALFHPKAEDITVEGILYALADPVRAEIMLKLFSATCSKNCSAFLECKGNHLPKSTLSQHFRILREAGLIRSERKGVELQNTPRCSELKQRFGPLIEMILKSYAAQLKPTKSRARRKS